MDGGVSQTVLASALRRLDKERCTIDFETASELDVREVGAARYAEHPSTRILTMSYKLPGKKRNRWAPGSPFPQELIDFAGKNGTFEAHNAMFECAVWLNVLHKRMGVVMPKRWYDTMARCAQRALPLGLDEVGRVLKLDIQKDKHGKYLLQRLSKPRKALKADLLAWAEQHGVTPLPKKPKPTQEQKDAHALALSRVPPIPTLWTDPNLPVPAEWADSRTLFEALQDYCDQDVDAEDELGATIGDMDESEYRLWVLDQKINWRGVTVDLEAVHSALTIIREVEQKLTAELMTLTGGEVTTGNQVAKIKEWAAKNGVILESLSKDQVEQAIDIGDEDYEEEDEDEDDLPGIGDNGGPPIDDNNPAWPTVKRVLRIRQQLSRGSTKKLKRMLECVCGDGKLRGLLQYHGAMSGRWAGRLAQPHNFPRGNPKIVKKGIEPLIAAIKCRSADLLTVFYGDPMDAIASSLRGMLISSKGKKFRVADFSAIEARVTMWLAGETEALEAFRKSDRKEGPDIYCVMASKLYNRPIDKDKDPNERQLGKITILGCGYQMGPDKLKFQAKKDYKVDLTEEQAAFLVGGYRESFPKVKGLWYGLEEAAVSAVKYPGRAFSFQGIVYQVEKDAAGSWLTCRLPNGRKLFYYTPEVNDVQMHGRDGKPWTKKQLGYWGRSNKHGGRWTFVVTYGGMLTENVVQAISRDILAEAMARVEVADYPIVLTVHDEVISEDDEDHGTQKEFEDLMMVTPGWLPGCPINVEGWHGHRYRKA